MSNWNAERINKLTGTKFTPAGYDYAGYNADGFDRYGYDAGGFNAEGLDKYGNARGTNLEYNMTLLLTFLITHYKETDFTQSEIIPTYHSGNKKWYYDHKLSFELLAKRGFIVKSGRRWNLVEEKALPELYQASYVLVN